MVVLGTRFPWWLAPSKNLRYQLILSRKTDDQRILQPDWMRRLTVNTQRKVVVSLATIPWWLTPCMRKEDMNQYF